MGKKKMILDGNQAAAHIAYRVSEVCAIYPITPATPMGEYADLWSSQHQKNIWGDVPRVVEMQSEGGAAGAVHGSLQAGSLTTTFTASQGLLLMLPNMYKISGELQSAVFHIAARTVATHALSIFGDHSDVMAARPTGFAMLFSSSVQEAMDMALIAHAVTLRSRIPFLHIFDGFRTSHEVSKIEAVSDDTIRKMIDEEAAQAARKRGLNPEHPLIRGSSQNPDVFFQAREAANPYYERLPEMVKDAMRDLALLTGRSYSLFDYFGHPEAERVIIIMGSGAGAVQETVSELEKQGEKIGFVTVRLYRPFQIEELVKAIPDSVQSIAVLDRTKEPGSMGEPLYLDVVNAFVETREGRDLPTIIGGRYGLSSKEFTPAMVKGVFDELKATKPKNHFTIGINDDVSLTSLDYDPSFQIADEGTFNGMFFGLGADGTVSANKNSIKIIGETTDNYVQGYFVYDSKKAGALTISHLRFGKKPIRSTYLISHADFVACHQFNFLETFDVLDKAKPGATFLLNAPFGPDEVWDKLPRQVQQQITEKALKFFVIDASKVAKEARLGSRVNTILQTSFFAISGILDRDEAIEKIKKAIQKSYSHKGDKVVEMNFKAVDRTLENLHQVDYPLTVTSTKELKDAVPQNAPDFVKNVLGIIMSGKGDELPVSAFPVDGTFPTATSQWEKRNIADMVPVWDEDLCTQCNKCVIICPHAAIRAKIYDRSLTADAPSTFKHIAPVGKDFDKEAEAYTLQVAVEDCTGCDLCVQACPISSKQDPGHKAVNMADQLPIKEVEQKNWEYFLQLPDLDRTRTNIMNVKGSQLMRPLFEFSGACSGCGETPYLKLLTQLYGEQMLVANATGCSSIYGGNLPSTPWAMNLNGRGPAWANSLFEDNAEFGLGMRLAVDKKHEKAVQRLLELKPKVGEALVAEILEADMSQETALQAQNDRIKVLRQKLAPIDLPAARDLEFLADNLVKKSVWIVGGDGWAYDIGFGGVDHVLASGEDVNIIVLDTEVYSNTGGQTSKATSLGASAKFSISGKRTPKKNLALQAIAYGNVYVAQIAMGAKDVQSIRAINEANIYPGTSLIVAYSHCIEHGMDMGQGGSHQAMAVKSGHWPLFRFNPLKERGKRFMLDSKPPEIPLEEYLYSESRYARVVKQDSKRAKELLKMAEEDVSNKWERIQMLKQL